MKIIATSDLHGTLPDIKERCDAVVVAGDIVPLAIQRDYIRSVVWFSTEFVNWCMSLNCEKVFVVGGNHDFFFEWLVQNAIQTSGYSKIYAENFADKVITRELMLPEKIVYLQDSAFDFNGKIIYGSPWCPSLKGWAFYKSSEELAEAFEKIPQDVDLLITHAPGFGVNRTGISLDYSPSGDYGSKELTIAVENKNVKYWVCGHVHTGNHNPEKMEKCDTIALNASYKNEDYIPAFNPLSFEI